MLIRRKKAGFFLIDGGHRLAAVQRLGFVTVPVRVYTCTDVEARALEASQNLAGASLSPLDDALFLVAFKAAHEELHPETKRGIAGAASRWDASEQSSVASVIAEKRGITPRQVYKVMAASLQLTKADADALRKSSRKVTWADIARVGKVVEPTDRAAMIAAVADGKTVGDALRQIAAQKSGVEPAIKDPVEQGFKALTAAWARAPLAAKKRFLYEMKSEVCTAQNKGTSLANWAEATDE